MIRGIHAAQIRLLVEESMHVGGGWKSNYSDTLKIL